MPNTGETTGQESTTPDPNTAPAATTEVAPESKPDPWDGIPDEFAWAKSAVESANREAAARRVALREAEEKLSKAKTPEEFEAAVNEIKSSEQKLTVDLERERAARKHKLDDEVLEFLTGTTAEQIEAQAAKLAALKPGAPATQTVVVTQPTPTGGITPGDTAPKATSGRDEWRAYKDRR
jgi:hypothetical protein